MKLYRCDGAISQNEKLLIVVLLSLFISNSSIRILAGLNILAAISPAQTSCCSTVAGLSVALLPLSFYLVLTRLATNMGRQRVVFSALELYLRSAVGRASGGGLSICIN